MKSSLVEIMNMIYFLVSTLAKPPLPPQTLSPAMHCRPDIQVPHAPIVRHPVHCLRRLPWQLLDNRARRYRARGTPHARCDAPHNATCEVKFRSDPCIIVWRFRGRYLLKTVVCNDDVKPTVATKNDRQQRGQLHSSTAPTHTSHTLQVGWHRHTPLAAAPPSYTPDTSSTRINSTQVELRSDHYMHRF